jgi:hypothetical protein
MGNMINKRPTHYFKNLSMSLVLLVILLISCNLPGLLAAIPPTAQPSQTPLPTVDTPTAMLPTTTVAPPSTLLPTVTATKAPVNILFATGTTAAVEQGTIGPNQVQAFTLSAGQYQPMILLLNSQNKDATLGVTEPDGNILLDPSKKWSSWQWLLPKTEVYTITVHGGTTSEDYTLTTKVAERILFASGTSSITMNGSTPKGFVFSYAIACTANQVMTVSLNIPASKATLDIFGLATGKLLSASAKVNTWTGTLPASEDYIIEVIPANGQVVNYVLTVGVH